MMSDNGFEPKEVMLVAKRLNIDFNKEAFDLDALVAGMNAELEHKNVTHKNPKMTAKIALDHLREDPNYYNKLGSMELQKGPTLKLEHILNEFFKIDDIVDKINSAGDSVLKIGSNIPGLGQAAQLGKASLPNNKYWKAAQILAAATGLATPMATFNLINKARKGDQKAQGQLQMMAAQAQAKQKLEK